jgi:hypothetical protein
MHMNIELKPRIELFPAPASANDNVERWNPPAQRRRVLIYKPAK